MHSLPLSSTSHDQAVGGVTEDDINLALLHRVVVATLQMSQLFTTSTSHYSFSSSCLSSVLNPQPRILVLYLVQSSGHLSSHNVMGLPSLCD